MKVKLKLGVLFLILFLTLSCSDENPVQVIDVYKPITVEQQKEDVEIVRSILVEACPILEVHRTEEEVKNHFGNLKQSLNQPALVSDFYLKMGRALSFFHDGHLRSYVGNDFYDSAALEKSHIPISIEFLNERMYIRENYSESDLLKPKSEILSINGVSAKDIIYNFKGIHSSDGNNDHFKYYRMNREFRSYLMYYFKFPNEYILNVKTQESAEPQNIRVEALKASTIKEMKDSKEEKEKKLFSIDYDDSRKLAVFRFTTFGDQDGEKQLRKIMKGLVKTCHKKDIETLIIDIRDNGGGFDGNAAIVYSYIAQKPFHSVTGRYIKTKKLSFTEHLLNKNIEESLTSVPTLSVGDEFKLNMQLDRLFQPNETVFTGETYLLINRATFSTATLFASIFNNNKRGLIVGQNAGGGYHGDSGGIAYVELPNSKLLIQVPLVRNEYIVNEEDVQQITIKPDIFVNLSVNGINSETDEVMKTVWDKISAK